MREKPYVGIAANGHGYVFTDRFEWFDTWREALDYGYTVARVRHVVTEVIDGMEVS